MPGATSTTSLYVTYKLILTTSIKNFRLVPVPGHYVLTTYRPAAQWSRTSRVMKPLRYMDTKFDSIHKTGFPGI